MENLKAKTSNTNTKPNTKLTSKMNIPIFVLAILMIAATIYFAYYSTSSGILYVKTNGDPAQTVQAFYEALVSGDYTTACSYLKDYTSLGIENIPEDEDTRQIYEALLASYSYEISATEISADSFTASATISFSSLDVSLLDDDIAAQINPLLENRVKTMSRHDLYDDEGNYKSSLLNEVYSEAFSNTLSRTNEFISSSTYSVKLDYVDDRWLILVNENMINGFLGKYTND